MSKSLLKTKVCVVGLGYIGLPTAALLAQNNYSVLGVDINESIVQIINQGEIHIIEADLDKLVFDAVKSNFFRASLAPEFADIFIIAVPTPFKDNHEADMRFVQDAALSIATVLKKGNLVILESTSPVGTTEKFAGWLSSARKDLNFFGINADVHLAYCPERVLPGKIISELIENDRVIGGFTPDGAKKASAFYQTFVRGNCVITDARTAEMTKLTENAFRDVNIGFANELSLICDNLDINVWELIKLANLHPRVNILNPGPGVGGHCIAVDPWFIVNSSPSQAKIIRTAREVNDDKPNWVISKIISAISGPHFKKDFKLSCLGLSFKADIDDLRESPALEIVSRLANLNISTEIMVVEPNIKELPIELTKFSNIKFIHLNDAIELSDILVLLVDHKEFKTINRKLLIDKIIIDTRGIWS
jgi:UDP-N-acetyl-D-mannosaminuronic acid dehydrogenase